MEQNRSISQTRWEQKEPEMKENIPYDSIYSKKKNSKVGKTNL